MSASGAVIARATGYCRTLLQAKGLCMGWGNVTLGSRGHAGDVGDDLLTWLKARAQGGEPDFAERVAAGHGKDHAGLACSVRRGVREPCRLVVERPCGSRTSSW